MLEILVQVLEPLFQLSSQTGKVLCYSAFHSIQVFN